MNTSNTQRGGALWIVLAIIGVVVASTIGLLVSYHGSAVKFENRINAGYSNNQNILGQYSLQVSEALDVAGIYADDVQRITREAMQGRYGDNGSRAVFNWVQENNLQLDSAAYTNVQQLIQAGRNKFENGQTQLLDVCQNYANLRQTFPGNVILGMFNFPRDAAELEKKCTPVISSHARDSFETGIDDGLDLRRRQSGN